MNDICWIQDREYLISIDNFLRLILDVRNLIMFVEKSALKHLHHEEHMKVYLWLSFSRWSSLLMVVWTWNSHIHRRKLPATVYSDSGRFESIASIGGIACSSFWQFSSLSNRFLCKKEEVWISSLVFTYCSRWVTYLCCVDVSIDVLPNSPSCVLWK